MSRAEYDRNRAFIRQRIAENALKVAGTVAAQATTAYLGRAAYRSFMSPPAAQRFKGSLRGGGGFRGRARFSGPLPTFGPKPKSRGFRASSGVVRVAAAGESKRIVRRKTKKKSHKKRSLKKRVAALETKAPPVSRNWRLMHEMYWMRSNAGHSEIYEYEFCTNIEKRLAVGKFTNADNTKVKIDNHGAKMYIRNACTGDVHIEYQLFKCKTHAPDSVIDDLRSYVMDKGVAITNTVNGGAPATGTASRRAQHFLLEDGEIHVPIWIGNTKSDGWTPLGPIKKVALAPGSDVTIRYNQGKTTWDEDEYDNFIAEVTSNGYMKGDVHLLVKIIGGLGHDDGSHENTAYAETAFDCQHTSSVRCHVQNGLGQEFITLNDKDDMSGVDIVEHAEDSAPSITRAGA